MEEKVKEMLYYFTEFYQWYTDNPEVKKQLDAALFKMNYDQPQGVGRDSRDISAEANRCRLTSD